MILYGLPGTLKLTNHDLLLKSLARTHLCLCLTYFKRCKFLPTFSLRSPSSAHRTTHPVLDKFNFLVVGYLCKFPPIFDALLRVAQQLLRLLHHFLVLLLLILSKVLRCRFVYLLPSWFSPDELKSRLILRQTLDEVILSFLSVLNQLCLILPRKGHVLLVHLANFSLDDIALVLQVDMCRSMAPLALQHLQVVLVDHIRQLISLLARQFWLLSSLLHRFLLDLANGFLQCDEVFAAC